LAAVVASAAFVVATAAAVRAEACFVSTAVSCAGVAGVPKAATAVASSP
jgi:hypothetical protein